MIVIPAIDIKDGRCVRLLRGDFELETEYSNDPAQVALKFRNIGFSHLHIVDLDGAQSGTQRNRDVIGEIASKGGLRMQLGGGIRKRTTLRRWLATGIERGVIGSVAVTDSDTVIGWLQELGGDKIVLALDVRVESGGVPILATHGWARSTEVSLWDCVARFANSGLQHVLCTDISRDGAMAGPNVPLYAEFAARFPDIRLQASGGVRHVEDLRALRDAGAAAAITGRALLDGCITKEELGEFLQNA